MKKLINRLALRFAPFTVRVLSSDRIDRIIETLDEEQAA